MFFGALLAAVLGCSGPPERPNLVLITLDTTRADHLATWGYHRDTSKNLDAFAEQSIVFENLLVPVATTLPSHTTLLTGTDPLEHGVVANVKHGGQGFQPSPSLRLLSQTLHDEGYRTAAILSANPLREGSGLEPGFELYECTEKGSDTAQLTSRKAVAWIENRGDEPFFLWVHYFDPHGPFEPPKRHASAYKKDGKVQGWLDARGIGPTSTRPTGQELDSIDATNLYDGEIRYMDRQLGRVLKALDETGVADETVVVIVGDHGEGLGQHGMAGHGGVWREQLHAPLMIRSPWHRPRRVERLVGMADVLPTLAGLVPFPGIDRIVGQAGGVDALSAPPRPLYHHSSLRQLDFGRVQDAISVGGWRYVRDASDGLYHLGSDPHEQRDLSEVLPIHAAVLHYWTIAERDRLHARGEALGRGVSVPLTPDEIEQLELLGYVDEDAGDEPQEQEEP